MNLRHLAIDGPIGVGKTAVAQRLADALSARLVREEWAGNPFLRGFEEGNAGAAFQTEIFYMLSRYRQQQEMRQGSLFASGIVSDYLFEKTRLYAFLNLEDSELTLFEKLYGVLAESVARPDLVVYLQAPTDVLRKRLKAGGEGDRVSEEYLAEVNRAYNHYFFHYSQTPLLVVNTAEVDFVRREEDLLDLLRQIKGMGKGTQYYVPKPGVE
jgi:deoxyguanosine kinase